MKTKTTPTVTKPKADPVDGGLAGLDRALIRLVGLLKDGEPASRDRALDGLLKLGPWAAAVVLIRELGERTDARLRGRIVEALAAVGRDPVARAAVMGGLAHLLLWEPSPRVRAKAVAALFGLAPTLGDSMAPAVGVGAVARDPASARTGRPRPPTGPGEGRAVSLAPTAPDRPPRLPRRVGEGLSPSARDGYAGGAAGALNRPGPETGGP